MSKQIITLYGSPLSQPTRAVWWTCSWLGLKVDFKNINTAEGEHRQAPFLALNPHEKIPVISDGNCTLWESHAEMKYLVSKYAIGDKVNLYPVDLVERAKVDAWMDWKHSMLRVGAAGLFRRKVMTKILKDYSQHSMSYDIKEIPEEREARMLIQSLDVMESQLKQYPFIAGTAFPTLADIALVSEVEQLAMLPANQPPPNGADLSTTYPAISEWQKKMKSYPGFAESHAAFDKVSAAVLKAVQKSNL